MKAKLKLSNSERDFYSLVAQAVFSNPFSEERYAIDRQISKLTKAKSRDELVNAACCKLNEHIKKLEGNKADNIKNYQAEDHEILKYAFLFETYHFFIPEYNELIKQQIAQPATLPKVKFASKLIGRLTKRGLTKAEAIRYHSIFYQVRRAYYFIDQSFVGACPSMQELKRHLWNNVFTSKTRWYDQYFSTRMEDFSTFLLGETGTGKGTAAAAIGRCGYIPYDQSKQCFTESFMESFVSINLSQFQESLIESELFGHAKGAFTGAIDNHKGLFARCSSHGAVFLDEIGDVSVPIQIKLLNVIQERTFAPVGSHNTLRFNGRVIAATNQPIDKLRQSGKFRDDLYYRLCSDIIRVPSLSKRIQEDPAELTLLLSHIVNKITGRDAPDLIQEINRILLASIGKFYEWPGNVRELEQSIRRILISNNYKQEASAHSADTLEQISRGVDKGTLSANELLGMYSKLLYKRLGTYENVSKVLKLDRRTVKKYITGTL